MRCPDGVCVTSPLTRTNCGCITIDPAEISSIVATYGYLNPSTLCAYFASMANAGDATPGVTELVGVDCQRYTLPTASVTVSDTTTIDLTLTGIDISGDVKISPNAGNVLTDDGLGLYVPSATFSCYDLNTCSIDDLGDVDTTTSPPNPGDILAWDGFNWIPSNITTFQSGFYANKSGNQTITLGASTINNVITTWTELYDGLGEFNPITGVFTITDTGLYLLNFGININPTANVTGMYYFGFAISGTVVYTQNYYIGLVGHTPAQENTRLAYLTAGSTVNVTATVAGGTGVAATLLAINTTFPTSFSVQRVA